MSNNDNEENRSRRRRRRREPEEDTNFLSRIENEYNRLKGILLDREHADSEQILDEFYHPSPFHNEDNLPDSLLLMDDGEEKMKAFNTAYKSGRREIEHLSHRVMKLWDRHERVIYLNRLSDLLSHLTLHFYRTYSNYGLRRFRENSSAFRKEVPTKVLHTHYAHVQAYAVKKQNVAECIKILTRFFSEYKVVKVSDGKDVRYFVGKYINNGRTFTHFYETGVTLPWEERKGRRDPIHCTIDMMVRTASQNGHALNSMSTGLFDLCFKNATNFNAIVRHFEKDPYAIPFYDRTQCNLLAFRNGIYVPAKQNSDPNKESYYEDDFVPWDEVGTYFEGSDIYPMNYIHQRFPVEHMDARHPAEIPTPAYDYLHDYQKFTDPVKMVVWTLNGRVLYRLNQKDGWEVALMRMGPGGIGKSTDTWLYYHIFPRESIGAFSNKGSTEFTGENARAKLVVIADDVGKGWRVDSKFLQTYISGGELPFNAKYKSQIIEPPTGQLTINCNEFPDSLKDSGNSIKRRLIVLIYKVYIKEGERDNTYKRKLLTEIPHIILKWNRAYLHSLRRMHDEEKKDYWAIVDKYFHETSRIIHGQSNSLISFLQSNKVELLRERKEGTDISDEEQRELDRAGRGYWMSASQFLTEYKEYCKDHLYPQENCDWQDPNFKGVLRSFEVEQRRGYVFVQKDDFRRKQRKQAVFGLRMRKEEEEDEVVEELKDSYQELTESAKKFMSLSRDEVYKEQQELLKKRFIRLKGQIETHLEGGEEEEEDLVQIKEDLEGFIEKLGG